MLRKIVRRAITHGRLLGQTKPFLHEMIFAVRDLMQDAYPELRESTDRISKTVLREETRFAQTLGVGLGKFGEDVKDLVFVKHSYEDWDPTAPRPPLVYPGEKAFKLYDTFGVPRDFIEEACRDLGITLDGEGFDRAMAEQRTRARASWKGAARQTANPAYQQLPKSIFEGYRQTRSDGCEVLAIISKTGGHNGQGAQELKTGESGEVILDHTPFYAESGGQVGDRGWFYSDDHNTIVADVTGCYSPIQGVRAHQVIAKHAIRVGDKVDAVVNADVRESTMRNHTATHLLHAGLREVLGKHVKQAGSLVAPNHLRFDFSHFTAVEDEELQDIEDIINKEVLRNQIVETITDVPIDEAINTYHAMALFGEKYGDKVRVVRIGDFSTELCGGTHTGATGEIGLIKILKEGSVSSGVRRVEAVTGEGSLRHFRMDHELEQVVSAFVVPTLAQKPRKNGAPSSDEISAHAVTASPAEALKAELEKKDAEIKRLTRELDQARMKSASSATANIGDQDQGCERRESSGASRRQPGAGTVAHVGRSTARQDWLGRGGAGVGFERKRVADRGRDQRLDGPSAGGKGDWPGGAESWRQGRRTSRSGRGWWQRSRCTGLGVVTGCIPSWNRFWGHSISASRQVPVEDRINFVEHKGKQILLVDLSHCTPAEVAKVALLVPILCNQRTQGLGAVARRLHGRGVRHGLRSSV